MCLMSQEAKDIEDMEGGGNGEAEHQVRISLYEVIVVCKYVLLSWRCTEPCVFIFVSRDQLSNLQSKSTRAT